MLTTALAVFFALAVWWFSTGAVLYIVGLPREAFRTTIAVATALAIGAFTSLYVTKDDASVLAAYVAFTSAILVWAWHEISFLTGLVTGPRTTNLTGRSEPGQSPAPLRAAIETVLYHEIAVALTAAALTWLLAGSNNTIGLWTFVALWIMRLSAKLNIYLGVRNLAETFLPPHLTYLKTYFCRRPINGLFPFSASAACAATVCTGHAALAPSVSPGLAHGLTLIAALLALGALEHWFMVLPIPAERLWSWGLASRRREPAALKAGQKAGQKPVQIAA